MVQNSGGIVNNWKDWEMVESDVDIVGEDLGHWEMMRFVKTVTVVAATAAVVVVIIDYVMLR